MIYSNNWLSNIDSQLNAKANENRIDWNDEKWEISEYSEESDDLERLIEENIVICDACKLDISDWKCKHLPHAPKNKQSLNFENMTSLLNGNAEVFSEGPSWNPSQTTKVQTRGNTFVNAASSEQLNNLENEDEKHWDIILQLSAEKLRKFNFTPKVNPRLKSIKMQELKLNPQPM